MEMRHMQVMASNGLTEMVMESLNAIILMLMAGCW
jgi:hypothetical protein